MQTEDADWPANPCNLISVIVLSFFKYDVSRFYIQNFRFLLASVAEQAGFRLTCTLRSWRLSGSDGRKVKLCLWVAIEFF